VKSSEGFTHPIGLWIAVSSQKCLKGLSNDGNFRNLWKEEISSKGILRFSDAIINMLQRNQITLAGNLLKELSSLYLNFGLVTKTLVLIRYTYVSICLPKTAKCWNYSKMLLPPKSSCIWREFGNSPRPFIFGNWCLWGHFIMAREAQTIVVNGAQRLSGFILSLSRSAFRVTKQQKK